jgi:uncharacterized RDD family membrane protein YckC
VSELPPAGLWRRAIAALVDRLVGAAALGLGAMWLLLAVWALRGLPRATPGVLLLAAALIALALTLHVTYHVVLIGGSGQTVGAMVAGIAVVRGDGPPGYARAALRCAGGIVNALLLGLPSLPLLFLRRSRTFGDWVGGTHVVRIP